MTETNATSIGEPHSNFPAYDGQWRQAAWALVARGARMVEYWHWHSNHFGHEAYWLGVLNHDGEPGRCYDEVKRIAGELQPGRRGGDRPRPRRRRRPPVLAREQVGDGVPSPARRSRAASSPTAGSYDRIFGRFYEGLFGAGLQADVVYPQQLGSDADALVARWPVLVVPALYVADDMLLDLLDAYARAGGHLVLGFRSGYADDEARPRPEVMPGRLREAVGASYGEYTNLAAPVPLRSRRRASTCPAGRPRPAWADALVPEGAETLVGYEHPHLGRWAAVTTHAHGRGRVTYVGTLPDRSLAVALARWLRPAPDAWDGPAAETVTVTSARNAAGGRLRFVSNWSWEATSFALPVAARDLLSGDRPRERRGSGAGGVGCPGASGECPGGEQRGGGSP